MREESLRMFDNAYRDRAPLFGATPTKCVVTLSEMVSPGSRIADLGSGDGRDSLFLLDRGFLITALDLSKNAIANLIAAAEERGLQNHLEATVTDILEWNPPPSSFDAVIGVTILDHLGIEYHREVFRAIETAVRTGGLVALEMHSDRDPGVRGEAGAISEFVSAIESVSTPNYLLSNFLTGWRILVYSDRVELDTDHGEPHYHGFVTLLAQKESKQ